MKGRNSARPHNSWCTFSQSQAAFPTKRNNQGTPVSLCSGPAREVQRTCVLGPPIRRHSWAPQPENLRLKSPDNCYSVSTQDTLTACSVDPPA